MTQKQIPALSPMMILSTKILQMGTQELLEHLETVLQENPALDAAEKYAESEPPPDFLHKLEWLEAADSQNLTYHQQDHEAEANLPYPSAVEKEPKESLYHHVLSQLGAMGLEPPLASCAVFLAGCLNQNGWLDEDIAANYLEALAKGQHGLITQALGIRQGEVRRAAGLIRSLEPRPGAAFAPDERPLPDTPMASAGRRAWGTSASPALEQKKVIVIEAALSFCG